MTSNSSNKDVLFKSAMTSLAVCVPSFCLSVYLMEARFNWWHPAYIILFILGVAVANFASIVILENYRADIGKLTIPAMLSVVGLVLLFVLAEGVNRFFLDFGYQWLFPAVICAVGLTLIAIFRERKMALKVVLGADSVLLAVLWGLGAADKIALPF